MKTVADYQRTNYTPAAAFVEAVTQSQDALIAIQKHVADVSLNRALFHDLDWETVGGWQHLANQLQEIADGLYSSDR